MRHKRLSTPAYSLWVYQRPRSGGKGRDKYCEAVTRSASSHIHQPIATDDIEVEIVWATTVDEAHRLDADNVSKPTLDALKKVAYVDDRLVRSVTVTVFDRLRSHVVEGRAEEMAKLLRSPSPDVVLVKIYSDARIAELGGEEAVKRQHYEAWKRDFDAHSRTVR